MFTVLESESVLTREEIEQLVSGEREKAVLLSKIVMLIGNYFETDVCSIYLFEPTRVELVLAATVGLRQQSIGEIRMRVDEGLVGLVAESESPVAVEDAPAHPRFKYFPEAGEDAFRSFLGVPLFDKGEACGVLVVQTTDPREFSEDAIDTLVTTAELVGPVVNGVASVESIDG